MAGPLTSQNQTSVGSCAGDSIDKLRPFTDGCLEIVVGKNETAVLSAINLGSSVITAERILEEKCDVQYYVPLDNPCKFEIKTGQLTQPIKLPGRYRLCISPANPAARLSQENVVLGSSSCCAITQTCSAASATDDPLFDIRGEQSANSHEIMTGDTVVIKAVHDSTITVPEVVTDPAAGTILVKIPLIQGEPPIPLCDQIKALLLASGPVSEAITNDVLLAVRNGSCVPVTLPAAAAFAIKGADSATDHALVSGDTIVIRAVYDPTITVPEVVTDPAIDTVTIKLPVPAVEPSFCEQFQAALTAAGVAVTPEPTDTILAERNGVCVRIPLALALADVNIQSIVPTAYDNVTGLMSFTVTETDGQTFTVSYTVTPPQQVNVISSDDSVTVTENIVAGVKTFDLAVDLCPPNTDPPIELCPGDELVGCGGQRYVLSESAPVAQTSIANSPSISIDFDDICTAGPPSPITYAHRDGGGIGATALLGSVPGTSFTVGDASINYAEGDVVLLSVSIGLQQPYNALTQASPDASLNLIGWSLVQRTRNPWPTFDMDHAVFAGIVGPGGGSGQFTIFMTPSFPGELLLGQSVWSVTTATGVDVSSGLISGAVQQVATASLNAAFTEGGPQTVSLPGATGNTFWSIGSRHVGVVAADVGNGMVIAGGTKMFDGNSANHFFGPPIGLCNAFGGTAWSASNSITFSINDNMQGPPVYRDSYIGIAFNPMPVAPGGVVPGSELLVAQTVAEPACGCPAIQSTLTLLGGGISAVLQGGAHYRVKYKLNDGASAATVAAFDLFNGLATPASVSIGGAAFSKAGAPVTCGDTAQGAAQIDIECINHVAGSTAVVNPMSLSEEVLYG